LAAMSAWVQLVEQVSPVTIAYATMTIEPYVAPLPARDRRWPCRCPDALLLEPDDLSSLSRRSRHTAFVAAFATWLRHAGAPAWAPTLAPPTACIISDH
jgi:hypothetical protein